MMEVPRSERTVKVPLPAPVLDWSGAPLLCLTRVQPTDEKVDGHRVLFDRLPIRRRCSGREVLVRPGTWL